MMYLLHSPRDTRAQARAISLRPRSAPAPTRLRLGDHHEPPLRRVPLPTEANTAAAVAARKGGTDNGRLVWAPFASSARGVLPRLVVGELGDGGSSAHPGIGALPTKESKL